jgi:hypothetical protein
MNEQLALIKKQIARLKTLSRKSDDETGAYIEKLCDTLTLSIDSTINDMNQNRKCWEMAPIKNMMSATIAPNVSIKAYKIYSPNECLKYKGYWCWCNKDRNMYISINDNVYGGKCLDILPEHEQPRKFNEHINRDADPNTTSYYVVGGKDNRILTNKMRYVPALINKTGKYVYRLGSANNLSDDIANINLPEFRLFNDIVISYLLCLTAATK